MKTALVGLVALVLCAACGSSFRPPKSFPSSGELDKLTSTDAVLPATEPRPEKAIDEWALSGPLPDEISSAAVASPNPWEQLLKQHAGPAALSVSHQCIARETGLFYLEHDGYPSGSLASFIRNRCGSVPLSSSASVSIAQGVTTEDQARESVKPWLASLQNIVTPQSEVGIWYGQNEDATRTVLAIAVGHRDVELKPTPMGTDPDGVVQLEGKLLQPTASIGAQATRSAYDFEACASDESVKPPEFLIRCKTAKTDRHARISLAAQVSDSAVQARIAFDALVWPSGADTHVYRAPPTKVVSPGPDGEANATGLAQRVVELVNSVRAKANRKPLKFEAAQSATAQQALPHLLKAETDQDPLRSDKIILGLLAGWDVKGKIVDGTYAKRAGATGEVADLVDQFLESPGGATPCSTPRRVRWPCPCTRPTRDSRPSF